MKASMSLVLAGIMFSAVAAYGVTVTDNFSEGITNNWNVVPYISAASAPWVIEAPDSEGRLQIAKASDTNSNTPAVEAGILSQFTLVGDFTVSVDFNLATFNSSPLSGWNEFGMRVASTNFTDYYEALRYNSGAAEVSNGLLGNAFGSLGGVTSGTFKITRTGTTLTSWLDYGTQSLCIGSNTSSQWQTPMSVYIWDAQYNYGASPRPQDALDVRFDNFSATADSIISPVPEPVTIVGILMGLAGLGRYVRRRITA